jgi:hypothetical protein
VTTQALSGRAAALAASRDDGAARLSAAVRAAGAAAAAAAAARSFEAEALRGEAAAARDALRGEAACAAPQRDARAAAFYASVLVRARLLLMLPVFNLRPVCTCSAPVLRR